MSPLDAFGRETDEDLATGHATPVAAPAPKRGGPPSWVVWMVVADVVIAAVVVLGVVVL